MEPNQDPYQGDDELVDVESASITPNKGSKSRDATSDKEIIADYLRYQELLRYQFAKVYGYTRTVFTPSNMSNIGGA